MNFRNQSFMIFIDCIYFFNFYRNVGPFRKRLPEYNEDNIEMNNSIDCAIPVYHDTVLNTDNGSAPKDAIRNNTAVNTATGERQNKTYFSNSEYAVVVKKHPAGLAAQSSEFDLEGVTIKVNDLKLKMNTIFLNTQLIREKIRIRERDS